MSFQTKILVAGFFVVAFDAVASLLSRIFEFEYVHFIWFSFILYVVIGFWGAFRQGFGYGMLLGTIAGFTDSTIGWLVSWLIGPFIPLTYRGIEFGSLKGTGIKANFWNPETGEQYWISGCKRDGLDSLYANEIEFDEDVREEYWVTIRNRPELKKKRSFKCLGKYAK